MWRELRARERYHRAVVEVNYNQGESKLNSNRLKCGISIGEYQSLTSHQIETGGLTLPQPTLLHTEINVTRSDDAGRGVRVRHAFCAPPVVRSPPCEGPPSLRMSYKYVPGSSLPPDSPTDWFVAVMVRQVRREERKNIAREWRRSVTNSCVQVCVQRWWSLLAPGAYGHIYSSIMTNYIYLLPS